MPPLPAPDVIARTREATTYSAELRASVDGPTVRGRARVIVAFRRPDALRLELPGPTGPRLLAVAATGQVWAVFPADRAIFVGQADAASMEALLGVALAPAELMDLLVGTGSPRLRSCDFRWGQASPRLVQAELPDGTRLKITVIEPEIGGAIPEKAFLPPPSTGYRLLSAQEARSLWSR
jgi:hypothetical protein